MDGKRRITISDVEHVAHLARLNLSPEEKEKFVRQLNDILLYMEKLNELDTQNLEPLTHVLPLKNVFRKDEVRPGLSAEEVLDNAPSRHQGFFKVPPIIE